MRIISAKYGNQDRTSAVIMTEERGAVAVSEVDRPVIWSALMEWANAGGVIEDPSPEIVVTESDIAAAQIMKMPAMRGIVAFLADKFGTTPEQIILDIKGRLK